ncbi:MAG: type I-MYXAN CRISPR-associated protein Cas6/Cmx6 [gamma proteobacterium symbiont of Bathyaustriella thionipta]|nr:type I-MYXAN CRISPR-associated protein Cas6/Cmx6 [gamma proteobacterium symbiont of Bathyaustriella thionipta]
MYWQEEDNHNSRGSLTEVIDVLFNIDCKQLPVDHAFALSNSILQQLPWMQNDSRCGIHQIHVAASQNGWERPQAGSGQMLCLSKRTKLTLRIAAEQLPQAGALVGSTLDVDGHKLSIGRYKTRPLSNLGTVFSRYVVSSRDETEDQFLQRCAQALAKMDIRVRKALSGMPHDIHTPQQIIATRSLMLADLSPEESLHLQQQGLGEQRFLGCGIFMPHKGIDAVKKVQDDDKK